MESLNMKETYQKAIDAGERKSKLSISSMLIKSLLAGFILAFATSISQIVVAQGAPLFVGALLFPVGFILLSLLETELATGNFALLGISLVEKKIILKHYLRNISWVLFGNFLGSFIYALLFFASITSLGEDFSHPIKNIIENISKSKIDLYQNMLFGGFILAFIKAVLCNVMVCLASFLNLSSSLSVSKIALMWIPIFMFFAMGYEHLIVNMYALPLTFLWGFENSLADAFLWNLFPVFLGNIFAAFFFIALPFSKIYK